ncbi:glycosyltransferase family 8 protein [Pelagibacterium lentulum]|uniref:General stress protein A n=1 Tax=Pelagibacterium lentulum TaxID=2029865 RepID=A0A916R848_9HYPH|nr:glycosyltransferase family 8 protein [Pelagibacterium lentulum]GGA41103.1 general stress protein A [Pelagibacterium lentulum]
MHSSNRSSSSHIHVALAFDGNFWAPAFATMRSVCLFTTRREDLVFHLCCKGISNRQRQRLDNIGREFGASLVWHDLDTDQRFQSALSGLKDSRRLGTVIYARLMLDYFIPQSAERAIYLDCDVMVREAIERLYNSPLDGRALGAVRDSWFPFISMGRDLTGNKDLFDSADRYFNSGMMLIDLEKWRQANVWERMKTMIQDGTMARVYFDQDILNIIFKNDWLELDPRWNLIDPLPAHQAIDPFIVHFTGPRKPWNLVSRVAFARLYRHVMTNDVFYSFWRERMRKRLASCLPFLKR